MPHVHRVVEALRNMDSAHMPDTRTHTPSLPWPVPVPVPVPVPCACACACAGRTVAPPLVLSHSP